MRTVVRTGLVAAALLSVTLTACGSSGGSDAAPAKADATTTSAAKPGSDRSTTTSAGDETTSTDGSDDQTTTSAAPADGGEAICTPLKKISDFDLETAAALKAQKPWSEVQATYIHDTQDVLAAYDEAIAVAPADLAADLKTLRDFTAPSAEMARNATSLLDLGLALSNQDGLMEAGQAGLHLDAYARKTCGFGTSAAGG